MRLEEELYFDLSFEQKVLFICMMREKLYYANTKEERDAAIPIWIIKMVKDFEYRYGLKNFAPLFLGSFLMTRNCEDIEEIVCILNEIKSDQLHLTIMELDNLVGLSWNWFIEEDNDDKQN